MVAEELVADAVELVGGDPGGDVGADQLAAPRAASLPATRIRAMVSSSLTSLPVNRAGAARSTYSGRAICSGTGRRGDTDPGATGAATGMARV